MRANLCEISDQGMNNNGCNLQFTATSLPAFCHIFLNSPSTWSSKILRSKDCFACSNTTFQLIQSGSFHKPAPTPFLLCSSLPLSPPTTLLPYLKNEDRSGFPRVGRDQGHDNHERNQSWHFKTTSCSSVHKMGWQDYEEGGRHHQGIISSRPPLQLSSKFKSCLSPQPT